MTCYRYGRRVQYPHIAALPVLHQPPSMGEVYQCLHPRLGHSDAWPAALELHVKALRVATMWKSLRIIIPILLIAGCSTSRSTSQAAWWRPQFNAALAEVGRVVDECELKRTRGEVQGFLGSYYCANDRVLKIWENTYFPPKDLILRSWRHRGKLAYAVDAGDISEVQSRLLQDEFDARMQSELQSRF